MFDLVAGLPVHPLVVHAAVVLWPLGVLGLLAVLLVPRLRERYGWLVIATVVVGAASILVAKQSGEALARHLGEPEPHADYAKVLTVIAGVTMLAALLWWFLDRRYQRAVRQADRRDDSVDGRPVGFTGELPRRPMLNRVVALVTALLALWSLAATVGVGHTGAQAAWKGRVPSSASSSPVPSASSSAASSSAATYTMAQVKAHSSASSCWTAVDGSVYDVTSWIAQHPGGKGPIEGLCGTDGSAAFTAKHGGDSAPKEHLASMKIGTLQG